MWKYFSDKDIVTVYPTKVRIEFSNCICIGTSLEPLHRQILFCASPLLVSGLSDILGSESLPSA